MIVANPKAVEYVTQKLIYANVLVAMVVLIVQGRWRLVEAMRSIEISTTWKQPIRHCLDLAAVCWPTGEVKQIS